MNQAAAPTTAHAAAQAASAAELDARTQRLAAELRCLVCQNQTVADSQAPLALDLKAHVRRQLAQGLNEDQVRSDLVARYGDFVLYKPPVKASTAVLWAGPAVLLGGLLAGGAWVLRRRAALPDSAFEPARHADADSSCAFDTSYGADDTEPAHRPGAPRAANTPNAPPGHSAP